MRAAVLQPANEIERFVSRDAAADNEKTRCAPRSLAPARLPAGGAVAGSAPQQASRAGVLRRLREDGADFVLHGAAMPCSA